MSLVEQAMDKLRRAEARNVPSVPPVRKEPESAQPPHSQSQSSGQPKRSISIDRLTLRNMGYMPDAGKERQFADYYRKIKRPIIAKANELAAEGTPGARLVMIASALPGDGKTFTSINLALSIARERDSSVLLVDADVAKPHVSRIFGMDKEPGLLELLAEQAVDPESLVLGTDIPGFSLLPAGLPHEGATEMLASARMTELVRQLSAADSKRIVLLDSPPLLVSSESRALVHVAGQVVLVVRAGKTPQQAVVDAIAQTGENKSVSLVLNQGHVAVSDRYYTYGYGSQDKEQS